MRIHAILPPSGPGLSGDATVPEFGSKDCPSHSRFKTYSFEVKESDWKTAEDGRRYFVNPITGKRRYAGDPNQFVKFTTIPKP